MCSEFIALYFIFSRGTVTISYTLNMRWATAVCCSFVLWHQLQHTIHSYLWPFCWLAKGKYLIYCSTMCCLLYCMLFVYNHVFFCVRVSQSETSHVFPHAASVNQNVQVVSTHGTYKEHFEMSCVFAIWLLKYWVPTRSTTCLNVQDVLSIIWLYIKCFEKSKIIQFKVVSLWWTVWHLVFVKLRDWYEEGRVAGYVALQRLIEAVIPTVCM